MPGMGLALLFSLLFLSLTIFFRSLLLRSLPSSFYFFLFQQRHQVCGNLTLGH